MSSSAKRRQSSRVQGGWASRSDSNREPPVKAKAWLGKTVDSPKHKPRCYVYEQQDEVNMFLIMNI